MQQCLWITILAVVFSVASSGCLTNQSSSDLRMEQLMIDSEYRRHPFRNDPSSELTPYRVHGGVGPAVSPY